MASLLRLACAVGPYIAVLQVHADIIDDWSHEGVRKLNCIAKRFGFLIWEGGRILNSRWRPTGQQALSSHEVARDIAMARKRYTKGISVAAWAGLASTWVIGPEELGKGSSQLIPTLRRAARETVARLTMSVRTEISGGQTSLFVGDDGDSQEDDPSGEEEQEETYDAQLANANTFQSFRKGSVISLTRTITQHAEPSKPTPMDLEDYYECDELEFSSDEKLTSTTTLSPPPLFSRGVVICLPNDSETQSTLPHQKVAIASAKAHNDFVLGFVTEEPWINVRTDQALADCIQTPGKAEFDDDGDDEGDDDDSDDSKDDGIPDEDETYVIFSPLENEHVGRNSSTTGSYSASGDHLNATDSSRQQTKFGIKAQQIRGLHQLVSRALAFQSSDGSMNGSLNHHAASRRGHPDILYIPVVTMNV